MIEPLVAAAGLVAFGAITPGPNNLIVLRQAAERGWRGALPAVLGVVAGGLALLALVVAGAGPALDRHPRLALVASFAACAVLASLGAAAIVRSFLGVRRSHDRGPVWRAAGGFGGLFLFQFLNPKAWLVVVAAVAAVGARAGSLLSLAALFAVVPAFCLALWSGVGAGAMRALERPAVRAGFDRATGALYIAFAALLSLAALRAWEAATKALEVAHHVS